VIFCRMMHYSLLWYTFDYDRTRHPSVGWSPFGQRGTLAQIEMKSSPLVEGGGWYPPGWLECVRNNFEFSDHIPAFYAVLL